VIMMTNSPMIAGIEFHAADFLPLFLLLGLLIVAHLVGLPLAIWGHVKLYRTKRPGPLVYVLPLSWYFISLGCLAVGGVCQDRWSRLSWNSDSAAHYWISVVAVVLMSLHGLWVARLLRQAGAPGLCSWVLVSASLLLLLPPLGVILALVALRRIRESNGRLYGLRGAWASLAANLAMSLLFLVATVNHWPGWFGRNDRPAYVGTNLSFPTASGPAYYQAMGLFLPSGTNAVTNVTVIGSDTNLAAVPAAPAWEDPAWFGSGPFSGHWIADFNFERNTRHTAESPHPWETFFLTLTQEVHAVRGQMRGKNFGVNGRVSGVEADGRFQGAMRLSWDNHDWEEFTLALNEDRTRATGRAVFRANPQEQHYYKVELRRQR
jgi:hypothetical protein